MGDVIAFQTQKILRERVEKGMAWLDEHAPEGWEYNFFREENGERVFIMNLMLATTSILPLAFKEREGIPIMSHLGVAHYFNLPTKDLIKYSFHAESQRNVPLIEELWEKLLRERIREYENETEDGSLR